MKPGTALIGAAGGLTAVAAGAYLAIKLFWPALSNLFFMFPGLDKVLHFLGGAVLVLLLLYVGSRIWKHVPLRRRMVIALSIAGVIILADEAAQTLTVYRSIDWRDPLSGAAGAAAASIWILTGRAATRFAVTFAALLAVSWSAFQTYSEDHLFYEGILLERQQDYEAAYERYQQAVREGRPNSGLYNNIAWLCLEALGRDFERALEWAKRGVELDPEEPNVRDTLGWAYYRLGDLESAYEHVALAYEQSPDNRVIREHYELIVEELGREAGP